MTEPTTDHKEIWLEPDCCGDDEGRHWCQDDIFECEDGVDPTRYIRADLIDAIKIKQLKKDFEDAVENAQGWKKIAKSAETKLAETIDFAIWLTGCGYDFTQHEYFCTQRDKLLKVTTNKGDNEIEAPLEDKQK